MSRAIFASALVAATIVAAPAMAAPAGSTCQEVLPEVKAAFQKYTAVTQDRDRVQWQIAQGERLCKEGKDQQASGYLDLAHSMLRINDQHK
jgi:hypothetical protein